MKELISREELLSDLNRPFGHTIEDRSNHIPFLLVQMEKDIGHIIAAYQSSVNNIRSLKGIQKVYGVKSSLLDIDKCTEALSLMKLLCDNILKLTKDKTITEDVERRYSVAEKAKQNKKEATKVALTNIRGGHATVESKKKTNEMELVKSIISRQKRVQSSIQSQPKARVVTPKTNAKKRSNRPAYNFDATITLRNKKQVQIPAPEFDPEKAVYTIRELITHLLPYDGQGIKRIIKDDLHKHGRCLVSSSAFQRHFVAYKRNNILPSEDDYGGINGRKPILETEKAPEILNGTIHENVSYVENGIDSTKEILIETKKRKAEEMGRVEYNLDVSRRTQKATDRLGTLLDPNCSKTQEKTSRLKSENREIMSRSTRTCFTSVASCIASSFKKGKLRRQEYESLPKGCKNAIDIAKQCYGGDVVPIRIHNSINSDDLGRFITEGMPVQSSVKKKSMKTSKNSTARATRKTSSLWRRATDEDNYSPGIKVKFKSLISASGHTGPICIHFYGLTDVDLEDDFIILEVPGLCIGGDVIPNRSDVGYVILTKGSHDENTDSDVTLTERVMKWYHMNMVIPFIDSLRTMHEVENSFISDSLIGGGDMNFDWTVFSLDSEISYLNFLRRRETVDLNRQRRIVVKKISAAATESYQALDCGECFLELSSQLKNGTMKNSSSSLSKLFREILNKCASFKMRNKSKIGAMVDAVSCAPSLYKLAFEKQKIQNSFSTVGEITNIGSKDSPQYIACPDIDIIQKRCKTTWTFDQREHFNQNLKSGVEEIMRHGYISEEWFDARGFPNDTRINGDEVERKYSLEQMHMQRHVLLSNREITSYFRNAEENLIRKKQNVADNLYQSANQIIKLNEKATEELTKYISKTQPDGTLILDWNCLTLQQMNKVTSEKLRAFYLVRTSENLVHTISEKNQKLKKGNPEQVESETLPPNGESQFNLGRAHAVRNQPVIATAPGRAPRIAYTQSLIQPPSTIRMEERPNFNVTTDFVRKACVSISSLDDRGEEFQLQQLQNMADLDDDTFSDVLLQRLSLNLEIRECPMDHIIWKEFFIPNLKRGAAIVKMHGCVLNNSALRGQGAQDSLFSNSFREKMECLSGRDGALLDDIPDQLGAYLFEDEPGIGICRAGSASVGLRKRYNGHVAASKRESPNSSGSNFYNCYPDKSSNGGEMGIKGNFEDLRQITGVRFTPEMRESVIELLEWDDAILSFLENRGTESLLEKKNRMVCYFFEKIFDLMIGLHMNLSRNPGFERFLGIWNNSSIERI